METKADIEHFSHLNAAPSGMRAQRFAVKISVAFYLHKKYAYSNTSPLDSLNFPMA
jgi:hypothetical protein